MYELDFAREHLFDLFTRASRGEEVIIVRIDGRACALVPLSNVPADANEESSEESEDFVAEAIPA